MNNNELKHYGVLGMKWGVRKDRRRSTSKRTLKTKEGRSTSKRTPKTKKERASRNKKIVKVGASVAAGLISGSLGASGVYALTGSQTAAEILGPCLAVIGGMKYYDFINS